MENYTIAKIGSRHKVSVVKSEVNLVSTAEAASWAVSKRKKAFGYGMSVLRATCLGKQLGTRTSVEKLSRNTLKLGLDCRYERLLLAESGS